MNGDLHISKLDPIQIVPNSRRFQMSSNQENFYEFSKKVCLFYFPETKALAERIAAQSDAIQLRSISWRNHVIMSNIYAQAGQWDGVSRVRRLMIDRGIKKSIACSWIKVKNEVHAFLSGDTSHPTCDAIYAELERLTGLITDAGYAPTTRKIFHDVEDGEKTGMVCSHSERLAIAFGLINSQPGTTLLIRLRSS
ncbi:pentatricopeptide repeat-containing protein At1g25360-like isoform X1 [Spinacia oleracea]|uniref:Pentatricopeptide repeat-containing protein At1g25360-like isoform X1 n=1 Tax=Spinacia oleracea TaxID=3562 RepID=A0ABM3RNH0_SPIOL|nr:pentatricopeptide repeat-containing protein At1g25360-like isoform X1 [Spinacia oleracea]